MFVSSCVGCFPVQPSVAFWTPYMSPDVNAGQRFEIPKKTSSFHISDILHLSSQSPSTTENETSSKGDGNMLRLGNSEISELRERENPNDVCRLTSALAPLKDLCKVGIPGYVFGSYEQNILRHRHSAAVSKPELKFGINRILSDEFGKKCDEKENKHRPEMVNSTKIQRGREPRTPQRICECSSPNCSVPYSRGLFPTQALSAVHALQPPQYPAPIPGSDVLPGPYCVLNTDGGPGAHQKRKRSWSRAVFSNLQRKGLEKRFEVQKYVTKPDRRQLAAMLGLTDAQVKVWFQNRRMKWRHAQQMKDRDDQTKESADDADMAKVPDDNSITCDDDAHDDDDDDDDDDVDVENVQDMSTVAQDLIDNETDNNAPDEMQLPTN